MLSEYVVKTKSILKAAELFGDDYVRKHKFSACSVVSYDYTDHEANVFLGFERTREAWTEFIYMAVNKNTGDIRYLDYKLPNGERMKNPPLPVIYA